MLYTLDFGPDPVASPADNPLLPLQLSYHHGHISVWIPLGTSVSGGLP